MQKLAEISRWLTDDLDWYHCDKARRDLLFSLLFFALSKFIQFRHPFFSAVLFFSTTSLVVSSLGQRSGILFCAWGYVVSGVLIGCTFFILSIHYRFALVYVVVVSGVTLKLFRGLLKKRKKSPSTVSRHDLDDAYGGSKHIEDPDD
jgi:hypothetical protein